MQLKKSLIKIIKLLGIGFTVLYPFIVFFALKAQVAWRVMAIFLLAVAGISLVRNKNIWMFFCILFLCLGLIICKQDIFLKLYPVVMNLCVCLMFAGSVRGTPVIEKFAVKMGYILDNEQKKQTKYATYIWAGFMGLLTVISLITVFLSNAIWVWFNGLISYILIAIMIGAELLIHKKAANVHRNK